jgi:hypothetical protein
MSFTTITLDEYGSNGIIGITASYCCSNAVKINSYEELAKSIDETKFQLYLKIEKLSQFKAFVDEFGFEIVNDAIIEYNDNCWNTSPLSEKQIEIINAAKALGILE